MEDLRYFSEVEAEKIMKEDPTYQECLKKTSSSADDAKAREKVYSDVMGNYENLKEAYKTFSGMAEIPLLSNQYFNASMASYVRSFAGFLTVERYMDQPTSLLWYNDLLGVVDNRIVLPNLGKENLEGINARFQTTSAFVTDPSTLYTYDVTTNKKLIPGSVELRFVHAAAPNEFVTVKDDRKGNLLAPAGILAAGSVNYLTGLIHFEINATGFPIVAGDSYSVIGFEDVAGDPAFGQLTGPGNNRFKVDMKNITLTSEPDMLIGENNLMAIAAAKKAMGMDPQAVTGAKLTELYTKLINGKLTKGIIEGGNTGDFKVIPMDEYSSHFVDYQSRLDAFMADLVEVDTMMAKKTYKATKATCYVVGEGMGNQFRKLRTSGQWVDNTESTYINDLLGYFNGIPVLRHIDVEFNTGYACHKVPSGEIAPLMRGIYLPLTNTPLVGNYNNPTQYAQGVYYQEVNSLIFPELIQKFKITNSKNGPFDVNVVA